MGKGYWEYIDGEHEEAPKDDSTEEIKALKDWNKGSNVMAFY